MILLKSRRMCDESHPVYLKILIIPKLCFTKFPFLPALAYAIYQLVIHQTSLHLLYHGACVFRTDSFFARNRERSSSFASKFLPIKWNVRVTNPEQARMIHLGASHFGARSIAKTSPTHTVN